MNELVLDRDNLQDCLRELIPEGLVRVISDNETVKIVPVAKKRLDWVNSLRGMFADSDELTVDKFLERKHREKELEL